eukprot:2258907-Pleurochrysis_carterae.AAC.2
MYAKCVRELGHFADCCTLFARAHGYVTLYVSGPRGRQRRPAASGTRLLRQASPRAMAVCIGTYRREVCIATNRVCILGSA